MHFLTQLNSGCIDICKNMLKSAENVGLNIDNFIIACLDKKAYEVMKCYKGAFLYDDISLTEYQNWSFDATSNFRQIVKNKWKLIKEIYTKHSSLCWVDTDIVFKKNPLPIINNSEYILFQTDIPGSLICSGFMVFNNTKECQELVNICGTNTEEDDQLLINKMFMSFKHKCALLPEELFPNGYVYYKKQKKENAIIVHNNHMVGIQEKINKFKEENLWFLNNNLEIKVVSRKGSRRRQLIQENLNKKNIKFNFYDAADKTNIKRIDNTFYFKDLKLVLNTTTPFADAFNNRGWMKIGEVGCFFSHYALWKDLLNSDKTAFFILEDDANPQFTNNELQKFLEQESLNEIDMVLCQSVSPNFKNGKRAFKQLTNKMNLKIATDIPDWETTEGTTGYIITRSGASKLIEALEKYNFFNPVDNFITRCIAAGLVTFLCPDYLQVVLNEEADTTEIHFENKEQKIIMLENIKFISD